MKKIWFILIALLTVYGVYIIIRNLFSGDISKIIYVVIGVPLVWFISGKQEKSRVKREHKEKSQTRNSQNTEILVDVKDGIWTCPSCNERNKLYDICKECGQPVIKSNSPHHLDG